MRSLAVLVFLAGLLHLVLHVPLVVAGGGALALWLLWKLKWVILGLLGLDMLFGGGGGDSC
jgi:hypothetical protein